MCGVYPDLPRLQQVPLHFNNALLLTFYPTGIRRGNGEAGASTRRCWAAKSQEGSEETCFKQSRQLATTEWPSSQGFPTFKFTIQLQSATRTRKRSLWNQLLTEKGFKISFSKFNRRQAGVAALAGIRIRKDDESPLVDCLSPVLPVHIQLTCYNFGFSSSPVQFVYSYGARGNEFRKNWIWQVIINFRPIWLTLLKMCIRFFLCFIGSG